MCKLNLNFCNEAKFPEIADFRGDYHLNTLHYDRCNVDREIEKPSGSVMSKVKASLIHTFAMV